MFNDPVTLMITRVPRVGREREWESLMEGALRAARAFPGNLGTLILKPGREGERAYRILVRFDSSRNLRHWEESPQRQKVLKRLESVESEPVLIERAIGLETWFEPPGTAVPSQPMAPPRHKMMIASSIGVYLTITPMLMVLRPVLDRLPVYVATMVLVPIAVILLTYVVMPAITKVLRPWLYRARTGG